MNIQVRYLSKTGNTEKIANAIAEELNVGARNILNEIPADTDILFLGCAIYGFGIDEQIREFTKSIKGRVKKVAVFSTTALVKSAYPELKRCLDAENIPLFEEEFHARGRYHFVHKNRPDDNDIKLAKEFAKTIMSIGI